MASSIFNAGGGAGIGSYVIVFKNGILDPKTDFARLRGAYDSGDSIYLSLIGEGYDEALIPASGWVDENDKLHLVARDFDDGKTYNIDLGLNAHEAEVEIEDGIEINGAKIAEGASVPEPGIADRGLYLKVSDQGELEYAEGGSGGGVTEERVHEIVAEDTEDLVTQEELEEAISHIEPADGKITLDIETIAVPNPGLNGWYELDLGEYTLSDFEEHKFVLDYKGMIMEEVGEDYLNRMHVHPAEMPDAEGEMQAVFAFMGGDRIFIIVFYETGKDTFIGYGVMQPSAAAAVGDVNDVTNGYMDDDTGLWTQAGSAVILGQQPMSGMIGKRTGSLDLAITSLGENFVQTGVGMYNSDPETSNNLYGEASVLATKSSEEVEGLVSHNIKIGISFDGQQDHNPISGNAYMAAQAKWLEATKDTPAADDSSLILHAPNIMLQTAKLGLQTLDPTSGELGEPSKLLFGKYNSILNGTDYLIREATLRDIASVFPRPNEAYPALLLLDEGEMLEITNVFTTDESISGEIYDVKTGFHFHFEIQAGAGGEPEFTPDSTTPLFKLLKPFSAVADDDYNYTQLTETCVRPDGSYSFTSDISGLTEDTVYIAKDFSKIRIDDSVNFTGNQEYTVYAKDIFLTGEVPYGGQFWFLVPDTNSSTGFVSHWVKIDVGAM